MALAAALAMSPFVGVGSVAAQDHAATIDEITDSPSAYYGQTVTISGPVEDILGPRSFTLSDADPLVSEELPVVSHGPLLNRSDELIAASALDDRDVQVTGTVHQFNLEAFENQLGVDLTDRQWEEWAGQPAIIATSVMPEEPASAGDAASRRTPDGGTAARAATANSMMWTSVDRITGNPDAYIGENVAVVGEIGEVRGPRSFTVEDNDLLFDEHMVVVSSRPLAGDNGQDGSLDRLDGRRVLILGTVHQFNIGAFEDQIGINLTDEDFADEAGRPAMIANSIVLDPVPYGPHGAYPYSPPAYDGAPEIDPYFQSQGATVDTITDNPTAYYGRKVTVAGEVGQALGARSFTVEDSDLLFEEAIGVIGTRPLLKRNGQPYAADELDDLRVMVTGTVRQFNRAEIEGGLNIDLDGSGLDNWEGRPVIVADSVRQLP